KSTEERQKQHAELTRERDALRHQAEHAAAELEKTENERKRTAALADEQKNHLDAAVQQRDATTRERDQIAARLAETDANFNQRVNALNSEHKKQLDSLAAGQKAQLESLSRQREILERYRDAFSA